MTFASPRVAMGQIQRRKALVGVAVPVMESFTHVAGGNSTTQLVTKPSGTVENDLLLCLLTIDNTLTEDTLTPPADALPWILLEDEGTLAIKSAVFYKIAGPSEPADYLFTNSVSEFWAVVMYRISGVDLTKPINTHSVRFSSVGSNSDIILDEVITDITNTLLIHHLSLDNFFVWPDPAFTPPGVGEVVDVNDPHVTQSGVVHATAHEDFAGSGPTGSRIWKGLDPSADSTDRTAQLIAIAPPQGTLSFLELEASTDLIEFEDGSGVLALE